MSPPDIDVDAYFVRIGYDGPRTPTLEALAGIHFHHPQAIPFENLDPLLKRPVGLTAPELEGKLVRARRGGWCFEQNLLLSGVLQSIGFQVTGLAARVMWNVAEGVVRARSHMLLKIDGLDGGPHIADVGFGGLTLTGPVRLIPDVEQQTPHEVFRLKRNGINYVLQASVRSEWKALYTFDLQPQLLVDYEVSNWHLAKHPESPFVNNLMAARVTPERRYGLFNNKLSIHSRDGNSEQVTLATPAALRDVLESTLEIKLPDDPGLAGLLEQLSTRT